MPKGITDYIIALILVAIVLVVVGYLIFTYYGGFNSVGKSTDCTAKKLRYCFDWQQSNYGSSAPDGTWESYAPGCTNAGVKINSPADCGGPITSTTTH